MNPSVLSQIEKNILSLPIDEQVWLIERIARRIRTQIIAQGDLDFHLAAMASDPEIQNEIRDIAEEFVRTQADGLEAH